MSKRRRLQMRARSKSAKKIRQRSEFDLARLTRSLAPPVTTTVDAGWGLEDIRNARSDQMRGRFRRPWQMARAMRADDAIFTARKNRIAPSRAIARELKPASTVARAEAIAREAQASWGPEGVSVTTDTIADIHGMLADHGVAFAHLVPAPRGDGSRVDFELCAWPIEWVRWDELRRCFVTQVESVPEEERAAHPELMTGGHEVPIIHGDGRWIVFRTHTIEPWTQDACVLAAALIWARHAYGLRDWSKGSTSIGNAKVVGELPEGFALEDEDGNLSPEARAFLDLLAAIASQETPFGIRPHGSKTDVLTNTSTAWQVWKELILNAEAAAARIYLGTDGTLGSKGGAPGVDIASLFGIATTIIQGDLTCIARGINEAIKVWCAVNFGDSSLAPVFGYAIPDPDAKDQHAEIVQRDEAFHAEIERLRENGFVVDEATVVRVAAKHGVDAPKLEAALAEATPAAPASEPNVHPLADAAE